MDTERQRKPNPQESTPSDPKEVQVYFWPKPDTEPVIRTMSEAEAIQLAVKATQARFRRKGIGDQEVLGRRPSKDGSEEQKAAAIKAHKLLLALLNNSSVEYTSIAVALQGYGAGEESAMKAMDQATRTVAGDESLSVTFDGIQNSYQKQFLGQQAVRH
jgi:hypothetical protein